MAGRVFRAHDTGHQHMASKAAAPLQALEQQGAQAEAEARGAESREAAATARSEALKEGIALMWQRLGCEALGLEELLGDEGVTDTNLMQYLGIIEQRINQLLLVRICPRVLLASLGALWLTATRAVPLLWPHAAHMKGNTELAVQLLLGPFLCAVSLMSTNGA